MQEEKSVLKTKRQIEEASRLFGILADSSRLMILRHLMAGESTVGDIVKACALSQANVSKHLSVLHGGRFVARRKAGNFAFYSVSDPIVKTICTLICERMVTDAENLTREFSDSGESE